MKKAAALILGVILGSVMLTSCFGLFSAGVPSEVNENTHKATPEEAVEKYIEEEGLDPKLPHAYLLIDKYIFMLYNDVSIGGTSDEKTGYRMSLPFGFKFHIYIPETPPELFSSMGITKIDEDYQFEIQSYKHISGVLSTGKNDSIRVYDSNGTEFEKLYNEGEDAEACVWIMVINELPKDYAIYVDYDGKTYTVIDAKKIKKLVG